MLIESLYNRHYPKFALRIFKDCSYMTEIRNLRLVMLSGRNLEVEVRHKCTAKFVSNASGQEENDLPPVIRRRRVITFGSIQYLVTSLPGTITARSDTLGLAHVEVSLRDNRFLLNDVWRLDDCGHHARRRYFLSAIAT